jgi:GNAT superfamily N-acetyltransferase
LINFHPYIETQNAGHSAPGGAVKVRWEVKEASEREVEPTLAQLTEHMNDRQRAAFRVKLQGYVRKPDRQLILAENGGKVLGLVCVIMQMELPSNFNCQKADHLRNFAFGSQLLVHPDVRNRGIGSSLHLQSLHWARDRGRAGHWLITHRQADWYRRRFGYEEFGRLKKKGVEKILMSKEF